MLLLIPVADFGAGAAELEKRFRVLAFVLRHLFPSSPKMIIAKGTVYAPFSDADKHSPARLHDSWEEEDLHITMEYELVS